MAKGLFSSGWWRGRQSPAAPFGPLEAEVMDVLWGGADCAVRDVQAHLARPVAYTTVMTTLDRLFKKGFVARRMEGRAFLYTAVYDRRELLEAVTKGLLTRLLADDAVTAAPVLSNLVDLVAERDDQLLEELERLVRVKRQRIRKDHA